VRWFLGGFAVAFCEQPLLLEAAVELAQGDTAGRFSLFNHTSLEVPMVFGSTGSATGNVHDSSYVALLPWLGVLGFNVGDVVDHMMKLGSVTWKGAKATVRTMPAVISVHTQSSEQWEPLVWNKTAESP
jgi:hypothetical protein